MPETEKIKLMKRIAEEGHSFPHYDTCKTCEEDFDEVFDFGKQELAKEILDICDRGNARQNQMAKFFEIRRKCKRIRGLK